MAKCVVCESNPDRFKRGPIETGRYVRFATAEQSVFVCLDHRIDDLLKALLDDAEIRVIWNPGNCERVRPYKALAKDRFDAASHYERCQLLAGCRVDRKSGSRKVTARLELDAGVLVGEPTQPTVMTEVAWSDVRKQVTPSIAKPEEADVDN